MTKLIRAGVHRYLKSRTFRIALLLSFGLGLLGGARTSKMFTFDEFFITIGFLLIAVTVSFAVGQEYGEGQFRNKLVAGHGRGEIFFSELMLSLGGTAVMFLLMAAGFSVFNYELFGAVGYDIMMSVFVGSLLGCLAAAGVYLAVSCLIPNRAVAVVLNAVLLIVAVNAYSRIAVALNQSEFYYIVSSDQMPQEGEEMPLPSRPEGERVDNPFYVGGVKRQVFNFVQKASPFGIERQYTDIVKKYLLATDGLPLDDEDKDRSEILPLPLYPLGVLVAVTAVGYLAFRRKEFK